VRELEMYCGFLKLKVLLVFLLAQREKRGNKKMGKWMRKGEKRR